MVCSVSHEHALSDCIDVCAQHDVYRILTCSLSYSADTLAPERLHYVAEVLTVLSRSTLGCVELIKSGVCEQLCSILCVKNPRPLVECVLEILGNMFEHNAFSRDPAVAHAILMRLSAFAVDLHEQPDDAQVVVPATHKRLARVVAAAANSNPSLPFTVAAPLAPLLQLALARYSGSQQFDTALNSTVLALAGLFRLDGGVNAEAMLLNFACGDAFDCVLDLLSRTSISRTPLLSLLEKAASLDAESCALVFTTTRLVTTRAAVASGWSSLSRLAQLQLVRVFVRLASASPVLAARVTASGIVVALLPLAPPPHGRTVAAEVRATCRATVELLAAVMTAAAVGDDAVATARVLLECGAVQYCTRSLLIEALWSAETDTTLRLLTLLQFFVTAGDTTPDPAVLAEGVVPQNPFVAAFLDARGKHVLDLLRYATGMNASNKAFLAQLCAVLENMQVIAVRDAYDEVTDQAAGDELHAFVSQFSDWQTALDAHVARTLEQAGYPRRAARRMRAGMAAPVTLFATPSRAALRLLQARARELALAHSHASRFLAVDATMQLGLFDHERGERCEYTLTVALDDARLPSHAAHFRAAAWAGALGDHAHQCFRHQSSTAVKCDVQPYVALYHGDALCSDTPLLLPDEDIVFGEYVSPGHDVTYPGGTVLICPRSVLPPSQFCLRDTFVFVVHETCAASALPGAVPVGRIVRCIRAAAATVSPSRAQSTDGTAVSEQLFNTIVLKSFQAQSMGGQCGNAGCTSALNIVPSL